MHPTGLAAEALDHVLTLFWCFFGTPSLYTALTKNGLEDMQPLAKTIHEKRLEGLYVSSDEHGLQKAELERRKALPGTRTKDKWKLRVRIFSDSHSIRPGLLKTWNDETDWIKLVPVSGKKNQLIIEFLFGDNVPVEGLWYFGWGVARHLVTALNIGTMGFW
jgi:hypothetical protein